MGVHGDSSPVNIASIMMQSTCSNLEAVIKPLTVLDNMLTSNISVVNKLMEDDALVST